MKHESFTVLRYTKKTFSSQYSPTHYIHVTKTMAKYKLLFIKVFNALYVIDLYCQDKKGATVTSKVLI